MFQLRSGFQIPVAEDDSSRKPDPLTFSWRSRQEVFPPFASISSSVNAGNVAGSVALFRKESTTGQQFPLEYCFRTKSKCPELTGLGVRRKGILGININVYALGIYTDNNALQQVLGPKYKNVPESELCNSQAFVNDIVKAESVDKTLRLVITYGQLRRKQFLDALEERLKPKMVEAGDIQSLDKFCKIFDDVKFKKGCEIVFCQTGTSKLVTKIEGEQKSAIDSQALCSSLLDIYLGENPASKDAKETFAKNAARALKA